jgi:hypothetical protein
MRENPERLAWSVLLIAFVVFCVAAVGFPLLVRNYLLNARQPLRAQVNAQRGIVRVEREGSSRPDVVSLDDLSPLRVFKGDGMRTADRDEGLLALQTGDESNRVTLTSIVVYENSDIVLTDAYSPRFGLSSGPHTVILQMRGGRVRIEVPPADDGRPVQVRVRTDHGQIQLSEGSYAIEVTIRQTVATVRSGQANVRVGDDELELGDEQRAVASREDGLDGPLPAERNLIVNGHFGQGIDAGWTMLISPQDSSAQAGMDNGDEGQPVVRFRHEQPQPSEVGLIQTLNHNVKDLDSLVLHLKVRVNYHSLSVCGSLGSECPVMVRVDYIDRNGDGQQWVHGFYSAEDPSIALPYYCTTCPDPSSGNHNRVPEGAWFLYDSPNLMQILPLELQPATIQSVRVYASGHSYDSEVTDVELLAQE